MAAKKETTTVKKTVRKPKNIWDIDGLLCNGVDYEFGESGCVDWKATLLKRMDLLMPNRSWFFRNNQEPPRDISDIEDPKEDQMALTLKATHWLLNSRGYRDITYKPIIRTEDEFRKIATYSCKITFKGNYETNFEDVSYEAIASASNTNVVGVISMEYLDSTAQNRALSRAVRGFLNVNIVSDEEMGDDRARIRQEKEDLKSSDVSYPTLLKKKWQEKTGGSDFQAFKSYMKENMIDVDAEKWEEVDNKVLREAVGIMKNDK
tara:strand:- start:3607 stop:4395 length:789 start_codon:yes stop_codon:yes gene_type:complete